MLFCQQYRPKGMERLCGQVPNTHLDPVGCSNSAPARPVGRRTGNDSLSGDDAATAESWLRPSCEVALLGSGTATSLKLLGSGTATPLKLALLRPCPPVDASGVASLGPVDDERPRESLTIALQSSGVPGSKSSTSRRERTHSANTA